jgi:Cu+-exporting ATPase
VLLVAAPTALVLAEPFAQVVARRRGVEIGVLTAGVDAMRAARQIDTIVLAKNGTVTTGELSVAAVDPVDPEHLRNLRWFAGALSHSSDHPIAHAIAKLAPRGRVSNVVTQPLIGISGSVDRHPVRIGIPRWIGVEGTEGRGTQVAVEVDGRALGWITVGDTLRPDARKGVERLSSMGLHAILVSNRPEADTTHLADQTGIETHYPGMTVDGCVALIRRLQEDGHVVAMVGKLATNAPSLRAADLAISTVGDVPDDGVVLAEIDIQSVGDAIALMRSTLATMLTNRRWAVIGMLVPVPFAAAGLIEPLYAPLVTLACMIGVIASSSKIPRKQRVAPDRTA